MTFIYGIQMTDFYFAALISDEALKMAQQQLFISGAFQIRFFPV